jgi:glycosyltransferase involved in cell wall biosynthesis
MKAHVQARRTKSVGVVLPVHNEAELLPVALTSLSNALARLPTHLERLTVIVLDNCHDASESIARDWASTDRCQVLRRHHNNVGSARRDGCEAVMSGLSPDAIDALWLSTTDADSRVPADWLTTQLTAHEAGIELWTGRVDVNDWSSHHGKTARRWRKSYEAEPNPVHGANLGINARAYRDLGGFCDLASGEDRDLYCRAAKAGLTIAHDRSAKVSTSSRREARAPLGFAHALMALEV